jgi:hypothetical protein
VAFSATPAWSEPIATGVWFGIMRQGYHGLWPGGTPATPILARGIDPCPGCGTTRPMPPAAPRPGLPLHRRMKAARLAVREPAPAPGHLAAAGQGARLVNIRHGLRAWRARQHRPHPGTGAARRRSCWPPRPARPGPAARLLRRPAAGAGG